ncbi:unnamed protein product [Calypogeia fissa]
MKKQTTALKRRRFERVVILVDITVILLQHEPKKLFAAHVFNCVSRILQQCNEHSKFTTFWGYKFFDPFHHPMASRSKIGRFMGEEPMADFDALAPNLEKFGKTLNSMVNNHEEYSSGESRRGDYVARAIEEVIGKHTWDPLLASDSSSSDEEALASKDRLGGDGAKRDSNAIIVLSFVPTTWTDASRFFNVPHLGEDVPPDPTAHGALAKTFRTVREALQSRNIHACLVDVPVHQGLWSDERLDTVLKPTAARSLILKSLSDLVQTVIPSDLLVVSPALLPCNVVWNTMADLQIEKSSKKSHARILCPGDALLFEVQLQPLHGVHTPSTSRGTSVLKTKLFPASNKLDIVLESAQPKSAFNMKLTSKRFLVRQSARLKASLVGEDRDSFGDKVLQLLDQRAFRLGQPGWQLLLLTLASKKIVCEVSISSQEESHSLRAVLEPFTSQCAILTVFEKEIIPTTAHSMPAINTETKEESVSGQSVNVMKRRKDAADCPKHEGVIVIPSRKRHKVAAREGAVINWQEYWKTEGTISALTDCGSDYGTMLSRYIEGGKASESLLTMDSFFNERPKPIRAIGVVAPLAVMDVGFEPSADQACAPAAHPDNTNAVVPLGTVSEQSADQACALGAHPNYTNAVVLNGMVFDQKTQAISSDFVQEQEVGEMLAMDEEKLPEDTGLVVDVETPAQEAGQADSTASLACQMTSEEAKEYIAFVGQKIEDYLTSSDVDSGRFAGMLVAESYRSLSVLSKQTEDDQQRSDAGEPTGPDLNRKISVKLRKLLLKSHKVLLAKYKNCVESHSGATSGASLDDKVKEYELQILLRMEMVSFDEGLLLEQTANDQLAKDVCKLLDSIQFHIDGGIFGGKNFLNYCDRMLVSRYEQKVPSTISKIYSEMELDGYSALRPPASAQESLQESSLRVPYTGDFLLCEAGVSQDSISCSERTSTSATGGVPSYGRAPRSSSRMTSREDSKGEAQSGILDKGPKKKGSYHFASCGEFLTRRVKRGGRHQLAHSKQSKGRGRPNVPVNDDVQIVCQTPMIAPSSLRPSELSQVAIVAPPKEFTGCKYERLSVEQPASVVEGTPVVRRRLTLPNFGEEDPIGSALSLDEMVADIDRTSNAAPNLSVAFPSKMGLSSFPAECRKKPLASADLSGRKHDVRRGDSSFSALLRSVSTAAPRTELGKLESHRGSHISHNSDEDIDVDDDDEDGIVSTPFKVIDSSQSVPSVQSSQSDRPNCRKRLKNNANMSILGF